MPKGKISPRETAAWAAYVLGHDIEGLRDWYWRTWGLRREAQEGKVNFSMELPYFANDLDSAGNALVQLGVIPPTDAYIFGRCVERWCHEISLMLIEFAYPESTTWFELWDDGPPPSGDYLELSRIARQLREKDQWLGKWFDLGEWMYSKAGSIVWVPEDEDPGQALFSSLASEVSVPELGTLSSFLATFSPNKPVPPPGGLKAIVDPALELPTNKKIEEFLRQTLRNGAAPEPWVVLTPKAIHFLGTDISPTRLSEREFSLLWRLCETPYQVVSREQIIHATQEPTSGYSPDHVPPVLSRLRSVLKHAVPPFVRRQGWDAQTARENRANKCFIVDVPRTDRRLADYQICIRSVHVLVDGERPKGIKPHRRRQKNG